MTLVVDYIIKNFDSVVSALRSRNILNAEKLVEDVIEMNNLSKKYKQEFDAISQKIKIKTSTIGNMLADSINTDNLKEEVKKLKCDLKCVKVKLDDIKDRYSKALYNIPNIPSIKCPIGQNAKDNVIIFSTDISQFTAVSSFSPHYNICKELDIIDFDLGNKLTCSGFPVYKGFGIKLQRALINFFLFEAEKNGFTEYGLPLVCNDDSFYGTGQMPDKEQQMYKITEDGFHLIPTAEVPLTNLYRNVVVSEDSLPIKINAYTPCFRREAGSWGKNVRGLNRLHQFDKVEIVEIVKPEDSYNVLEKMRAYVESLVKKLGLPYRVLALCTGDLGFNAAFTYDIEVYSVGQGMWLEVSSISNFETYQSNRLNLKYKDKVSGENILLHTLNGSALALPRVMAALLELYFDGKKIIVPDVLKNFL